LSPVPRGVPAKATGQCTLVFNWELVLYKPSMVGSEPEGGCTMTLHDGWMNTSFKFDLVVLLGSARDEFEKVV